MMTAQTNPMIPPVSEHTLAAIIVIMFLAGVVSAAIWFMARARDRGCQPERKPDNLDSLYRQKPRSEDKFPWFKVTLGFLLALYLMSDKANSADVPARGGQRVVINLSDCPSPGPGMTNTVVFIIESTADNRPTVKECFRVAMRPYQPTGQRKLPARAITTKEKP